MESGAGALLEPGVLEDLRRMLVRVAGEAAAYLRDRFGLEELLVVVAKHRHDEDEGMRIDVENEKNIMELLRAEGFRGLFLGEESGLVRLGNDPYIVVADPLDGSKNYAALVPWSAVSVAAAPIPRGGGEPRLRDIVAGAVAPIIQWPVVSFARGRGVYEGGARVRHENRGSRLILAYVEKPEQARVVHRYLELADGKRSVRALGSASLEITWAGLGRAEAFIDVRGRLRVVDVAAAAWIAHEAGAIVALENPDASLYRVERVGSVVVASPAAWARVATALRDTGHTRLADSAPSLPG